MTNIMLRMLTEFGASLHRHAQQTKALRTRQVALQNHDRFTVIARCNLAWARLAKSCAKLA